MRTLIDPMVPSVVGVVRSIRETHDTFTLELKTKDPKRKREFRPGQFNMIYVHGVGEIPLSISGDPNHSDIFQHTTRVVGTVTKALGELQRGSEVGVRGPFGNSWPVEKAKGKDVVLIAGGIGLAPLRPVIYHIVENRRKYNRVVLLFGARTPKDILFRNELEAWRSRFDLDIFITVDRSSDKWKGNVGLVTTLIPHAPFDTDQAVIFVCGPEIMMRFTVLELQKRGVSENQISVSIERNMKCAVGYCGHCLYGPEFICKDGPVFGFDRVAKMFGLREV